MIVVTGGSGFLGQSLAALLSDAVFLSSKDLDLTDRTRVLEFIGEVKPTTVVHLAARVGGINTNIAYPADFLVENATMDANLIGALSAFPPEHFIPVLSTCMYPDALPDSAYPMEEGQIEEGPPPPTNAAYAASKRLLMHGTMALSQQYSVGFTGLVPANLFGPGDHFGEERSHFLAAAMHRIEGARVEGLASVPFMGTGRAFRQYVYVRDVAHVVSRLIDLGPRNRMLNLAPVENRTIRELAELTADACGYGGAIDFTGEGPDGQLRKDVSIAALTDELPEWFDLETEFSVALAETLDWYRNNVATG
jgi:GDP-L-fucose synthase|tara:strand:+ start:416 stop:1339 length:924 start_codon:yes stop_codon:yes gene_type:complete